MMVMVEQLSSTHKPFTVTINKFLIYRKIANQMTLYLVKQDFK